MFKDEVREICVKISKYLKQSKYHELFPRGECGTASYILSNWLMDKDYKPSIFRGWLASNQNKHH